MGKLAEQLKEYFKKTPKEQQDKDWEKIKHLNEIGPYFMECHENEIFLES